MKISDTSQKAPPQEGIGKTLAQAQNAVSKLIGGSPEAQGQETLINYLSRTLSNHYTLMRNVKLEGIDIIIPMVLLGPSGISVISTRAEKGVFKVKAETISKMGGSKEFKPIRPSPINRTIMMAEAVTRYLREHNIEPPEIQPVMFFSSPGTHIESTRPSVRLVMIDGLERFASSLLHGQVVLAPEDIHTLVVILNRTNAPAPEPLPETQMREQVKKPGVIEPRLTNGLDRMGRKFSMKTSQWILLGVLAFFNIVILIVFIFIILQTA